MGILHWARDSVENAGVAGGGGRIECQENVIFNDFSRRRARAAAQNRPYILMGVNNRDKKRPPPKREKKREEGGDECVLQPGELLIGCTLLHGKIMLLSLMQVVHI